MKPYSDRLSIIILTLILSVAATWPDNHGDYSPVNIPIKLSQYVPPPVGHPKKTRPSGGRSTPTAISTLG